MPRVVERPRQREARRATNEYMLRDLSELKIGEPVVQACLQRGLITRAKGDSILLAPPLMLSSCDTSLDLVDPSFQTPETFFENNDELLQATNAIYSQMASGQLFGREWFFKS